MITLAREAGLSARRMGQGSIMSVPAVSLERETQVQRFSHSLRPAVASATALASAILRGRTPTGMR